MGSKLNDLDASRQHLETIPSFKPKKRRSTNLIKAALNLLRRRGSTKEPRTSNRDEVASTGMLKKVVGSVRPLHARAAKSPTHSTGLPPSTYETDQPSLSHTSSSSQPSSSHASSSSQPSSSSASSSSQPYSSPLHSSCTSSEGLSLYRSPVQIRVSEDGDIGVDQEPCSHDSKGSDDAIDAKADEFIAQFYKQMRIQNYHDTMRRNRRLQQLEKVAKVTLGP